ncbi:NAD-dependent epimerase/dehydratase family protein [Aeromicrobium endophyticum]|uniref:NAD-dependent epimerase/dehydratase family protein n=1 Tax=Aeromicrobium endophyticum TaxID=2292704 RepID=A0A371PC00_9ACTN|nr:NAD-dependent epimerase/dehydratase family protein [Aeromicrobium endophyticum]REK73432.1 NAD-dependent epimerase/dehydratase family protein [Aeromicrobium endophyticum]
MTTLVTGGGGFIGGHLVADLLRQGHDVRSVDVKPLDEWYQVHDGAENVVADCADASDAHKAAVGTQTIYNLAADMGGMGFIENNKAECMLSVLTSTNMLVAARDAGTQNFFYSSSACVYAGDKQTDPDVTALKESDAYPADPEDGYGWEKLFSERMARHFREDFGLQTRVARYHNVYGPEGTFEGGREKAPAALSRKIAEAKLSGHHTIDVWGDGEQSRSFMYIDDCVRGTQEILAGDNVEPVNLGSSELVTINQMIGILEQIAGITVSKKHDLTAPQGVRGRNSDNTFFHDTYGWEPSISLRDGLEKTYAWIYDILAARA